MTENLGTWLYAVADRIVQEWLGDVPGVSGHPVRTVEAAGLTAAVTSVDLGEFGPEPLRRNLENLPLLEAVARAHHDLIAIIGQRTTVIPMRLATIYRSDAGVAALLATGREQFAQVLQKVAAKSEWGVKVYLAQPAGTARSAAAAASDVPDHAGRDADVGAGTAYLRRRRQELGAVEDARKAATASAEAIHATLAGLAVATQLRAPQSAELSGRASQMILNASYLVPDERVGDFDVVADSLAGRYAGVAIDKTGPWPPYSFAAVCQLTDGPEPSDQAEVAKPATARSYS